ncbi:hypothetical protein [Streptomyces sp. NBC_00154]|uniref:hypothetical protein n=1 Tax=Streptomyces sp. NBC_00154 TaxID=2975670 RepID=UPI00225A62B1|nr:hypothetical protein [Streptomyces sp. NBC_00154]MCX5313139.1 hypothetical protein [Streptomyces sp. NBC_00154]
MPDEEQSPITHGVRNRLWEASYTSDITQHNEQRTLTVTNVTSLVTAAASVITALTPLIIKLM